MKPVFRRSALGLAVAAALAAPLTAAWSRSAVTNATATIAAASSANTYTLTLANTGDTPIQCMRFMAATGVNVVSVDPVSNAQLTPSANGFGGAFNPPLSQSPGTPTSPASIVITFHTSGPYPTNGGGTLAVSPNCTQDFTGTVNGPTTTTVLPCKCMQITVSMKPSDVYTASAQLVPEGDALARIGGLVSWTMTCTAGAGNCEGSITPLPPKGTDASVKVFAPSTFVPKKGPYKGKTLYSKGKEIPTTITCKGPCNASVIGKFFLQIDSKRDLLPANRGSKTVTLSFKIVCSGTSTKDLTLVFKPNGDLNKQKSTFK